MYEYITGSLAALTPTYVVIDTGGVGYNIIVSLQTYSKLNNATSAKLFIHHVVREDAQLLYGFYSEEERSIFRQLINVSGVGPSTGIMMLSSLNADEVRTAILKEDINTLKSVKGIGIKTAQRIVVDLKDKIGNTSVDSDLLSKMSANLKQREEALSALIALGFPKAQSEKTLDTILKGSPDSSVEELIKSALKQWR